MSIIRHEFGPDGVAYLREYLDSSEGFGKRLGPLLKTRELDAGTITAFVPSHSTLQQRMDFGRGGLFTEAGDGETSGTPALQQWIRDMFASPGSPPRLLCVEDALGRRTDAMPATSSSRARYFCGDDVYWCTTNPEDAAGLLRPSATWTPNVAIVTLLPCGWSDVRSEGSLDPAVLRGMAHAAIAVIVGAWDAEGWLIWEPPDATLGSSGSDQFANNQAQEASPS